MTMESATMSTPPPVRCLNDNRSTTCYIVWQDMLVADDSSLCVNEDDLAVFHRFLWTIENACHIKVRAKTKRKTK